MELVDIPPGADLEVVAVRVKGDSMYPAYRDNDILYYSAHAPDEAGFLNKECVVALLDGRKFVKVVERGSASGTYNLASHNAPTILDQQIECAAPVEWVKRG